MSTLIIVTGYLAALKTTIALRLEKDLNIPCLNKDHIKEILGDAIDYKNREENLKLSRTTFLLMQSMTKKMLNLNYDLIIEANFKKHEIESLKTIIDFEKTKVLTLFCMGDPKILYQRYVSRQPLRHRVHTSSGLMSYENFMSSTFEY